MPRTERLAILPGYCASAISCITNYLCLYLVNEQYSTSIDLIDSTIENKSVLSIDTDWSDTSTTSYPHPIYLLGHRSQESQYYSAEFYELLPLSQQATIKFVGEFVGGGGAFDPFVGSYDMAEREIQRLVYRYQRHSDIFDVLTKWNYSL